MCNFPGDLWLLLLVLLLRLVHGSVALHRRQLGSGVAICWTTGILHGFCGATPVRITTTILLGSVNFLEVAVPRISTILRFNRMFYRIIEKQTITNANGQ